MSRLVLLPLLCLGAIVLFGTTRAAWPGPAELPPPRVEIETPSPPPRLERPARPTPPAAPPLRSEAEPEAAPGSEAAAPDVATPVPAVSDTASVEMEGLLEGDAGDDDGGSPL